MEYYPNPSEKKWAVLYSTWCGTARDAAVWISEGMGGIANVFDIREGVDLKPYDHIVIGGAIRYGRVSDKLEKYLNENRDWLSKKICGLFVVCGNMQRPVTPEVHKRFIDDYLAKVCKVEGIPSKVFLGRVTPILLEPELREMMKPFGEYDNLKRKECMEFGAEVYNFVNSTKR